MPVYNIVVDNKPKRVELSRTGDKSFRVKVDDRTLDVHVSNQESDLENPISLKIDGKIFRVDLPLIEHGKPFPIQVEEIQFKTEIKPIVTKSILSSFEPTVQMRAKKPSIQKQVIEGAVTAPMTGRIIAVKVKKGEQVKQGQVLCVIEAMKMENEINALRAGVVQEVNVSEGAPVSEGEVLLVIS